MIDASREAAEETAGPPASTAIGREEGDFVVFDAVPIFDAHERGGVAYDERLLAEITANSNRRIRDTGDHCGIVIGHDCDPEKCSHEPPLVGLGGPFKMGAIGSEKPRPCIFARFAIWRDKIDELRSYPRRSVEIWNGPDSDNRYIDPISLLGASTPARALGLLYPPPPVGRTQPAGVKGADLRSAADDDPGDDAELPLAGDDLTYGRKLARVFAGQSGEKAVRMLMRLDEADRDLLHRYIARNCDDDDLERKYWDATSGLLLALDASRPDAPAFDSGSRLARDREVIKHRRFISALRQFRSVLEPLDSDC